MVELARDLRLLQEASEDARLDRRRSGLRDPALAEANNLIGSPESVGEKIALLREAGVDHLCALQFPHDTVGEMLEQMEWFARDVMPAFAKGDPHA